MPYDQQLVLSVLTAAGFYTLVRRREIVDSMLRREVRAELRDDPRVRRNGEIFVGVVGGALLLFGLSSILWP